MSFPNPFNLIDPFFHIDNLLGTNLRAGRDRLLGYITGDDERDERKRQEDRDYANTWEMYNRQRADALSDRDWMANYLSPMNQMARLKAAGLNPNLIYGQINNAAPDTRAASAAGAPQAQFQYGRPKISELANIVYGGSNAIQSYLTQKVQRSQMDSQTNLNQANSIKALSDSKLTDEQWDILNKGKEQTLKNLALQGDKIAADAEATRKGVVQKDRELDQADERILQNARKLDQADVNLAIKKQELQIKQAKTSSDIAKNQEDILKSIVYRQTNPYVRKLLQAQIQNAETKNAIDEITRQYTPDILDAQLSKNKAEVAKLYSGMTNDIIKSIPVLSYLIH